MHLLLLMGMDCIRKRMTWNDMVVIAGIPMMIDNTMVAITTPTTTKWMRWRLGGC